MPDPSLLEVRQKDQKLNTASTDPAQSEHSQQSKHEQTDLAQAAPVPQARTIIAAGALCWRDGRQGFQVLLIHRPRYDDWSFPKGKLEPHETIPECAVREVQEEVGLPITLGRPLPTVIYPVKHGLKTVHYWAAQITDPTQAHPDGHETNEVKWCTFAQARSLLTNENDRVPLDALHEYYESKTLRSWPLILLRHAKAKPRSSWTREEGERPLAATGKRQAISVGALLSAWQPHKIYTSPWKRCVETVRPWAKISQSRPKYLEAITESMAAHKPKKARNVFESLFEKKKPLVICTHRPVLPLALDVLKKHSDVTQHSVIPHKDPYLRPGGIIVAQVSKDHPGTILSLESFDPYDD